MNIIPVVIDESSFQGGQAYGVTRVYESQDGRRIRVRWRVDYRSQSWATAEVLADDRSTWTPLCESPAADWHDKVASPYSKNLIAMVELAELVDELAIRGARVHGSPLKESPT